MSKIVEKEVYDISPFLGNHPRKGFEKFRTELTCCRNRKWKTTSVK